MVKLKAYPKGSTEAAEWVIDGDIDAESIGVNLTTAGRDQMVTIPTSAGWIFIDPFAFAAFEIST